MVISVLSGVIFGADTLVVTPVIIVWDFIMPVPNVADGLAIVVVDMWAGVTIGDVSDINIGVLVDVNPNLLLAVMITDLKFVTTPSEEATPFPRAAFGYRSLTLLDRARVLQARMPSDHM